MLRYVAFLRGVNLGTHRRTNKEDLRRCFEEMGFEDLATFRTSGNVIFSTPKRETEGKLAKRVEAGLAEQFGFEVTVFLRSCEEVVEIAAREPFDSQAVAKLKGKLQVSFLSKKPSAAVRKKVLALATDPDLIAIEERELYWLPSGGISESDLDLGAIEALVGPDTRRTMGTVEQIAAKYC
jgi:uncharacterized protein (DUF1697 family)